VLAKATKIVFTSPYPQARSDAAEKERTYTETDEFETSDTNASEESAFVLRGWIRLGKLRKGVEDLANEEGHKWCQTTCYEGGEDSRNKEKEDMTGREVCEQELY
jgi:hypothetical protein